MPLSLLCGMAFGYAAQRGSICVVRGIEDVLDGGSGRLFLSFLRCSVWVAAISLPLVWLLPGNDLGAVYAPSLAAAAGALVFGVGAALNGGCAFGTITRLGAGDLSFAATILGLLIGFAGQAFMAAGLSQPEASGASPLADPKTLPVLALAGVLLFCARELWLLPRRARPRPRVWAPEAAVLVMGVAGGTLYAAHGQWAYTLVLDRGVDAMTDGGFGAADLLLLTAATIAGSVVAAWRAGTLRFRFAIWAALGRVGSGAVMGFGAALIPGGNDALVLHGLPALSPHAPVAYGALVLGTGAALAVSRRFGIAAVAERLDGFGAPPIDG